MVWSAVSLRPWFGHLNRAESPKSAGRRTVQLRAFAAGAAREAARATGLPLEFDMRV